MLGSVGVLRAYLRFNRCGVLGFWGMFRAWGGIFGDIRVKSWLRAVRVSGFRWFWGVRV